MYASTCIYMCCNTKRNIMKYQAGRPDLGSGGKSLCLSVLCFMLSLFFIFLGHEVDPIQWEIYGIDSCGETRWRAAGR